MSEPWGYELAVVLKQALSTLEELPELRKELALLREVVDAAEAFLDETAGEADYSEGWSKLSIKFQAYRDAKGGKS